MDKTCVQYRDIYLTFVGVFMIHAIVMYSSSRATEYNFANAILIIQGRRVIVFLATRFSTQV